MTCEKDHIKISFGDSDSAQIDCPLCEALNEMSSLYATVISQFEKFHKFIRSKKQI